jgi:hypothetical protein
MPNWVFNHLTIKGSEEDITKVKAQLNKPFTRQFKEDDEPTLYSNPVIAFWNIIAPPEELSGTLVSLTKLDTQKQNCKKKLIPNFTISLILRGLHQHLLSKNYQDNTLN